MSLFFFIKALIAIACVALAGYAALIGCAIALYLRWERHVIARRAASRGEGF